MNTLKSDSLLLILLLVFPGLLSHSVFNSMVSRSEKRDLNIYNAVMHSIFIYVILYPLFVLVMGVDTITEKSLTELLVTKNRWAPLKTVLAMVLASGCWGLAYAKFYKCELITRFFRWFGQAAEPPNIFAAILDNEYRSTEGYPFIVTKTKIRGPNGYLDGYVMGYVEMLSVDKEPREIYLTKMSYLDSNRNIISNLPEDVGLILKVDDLDAVEVVIIDPNTQS